jgi:precorrin-8X/cobalt-precorrin-8 methylmutase
MARKNMTDLSHLNPRDNRSGLVEAGKSIEMESFRIIDEEIGEHSFPAKQWQVIRRVIHTTGDFDYANQIRFHPEATEKGVEALRNGVTIFTDTRMIQVGLSPWRLSWFETQVVTPVTDPKSQKWAEEMKTTRSVAAFRRQPERFQGNIIAIGNAPTALFETIRLIQEERIRPALVIGVPVGFVQAAESKEALWQMKEQPSITVLGRKGGSSVAVAIMHALLECAKTNDE